jgi:hypothetical protein
MATRSYAAAASGVAKKTFKEFADMVTSKPNRLVVNAQRLKQWYQWYLTSSLTNNKKHSMIRRALNSQAHMKLLPSMRNQTAADFITRLTYYYRPDDADIRRLKGMLVGRDASVKAKIESIMRSNATNKDDRIFLALKSRNVRERLLAGGASGLTNEQLNQRLLEQGRPLRKYKKNRVHTQIYIHGGRGGNGGNAGRNGKVGQPVRVSVAGSGMHNNVPKYYNNNAVRNTRNVVKKVNILGGLGGRAGTIGLGGEGGEAVVIRAR